MVGGPPTASGAARHQALLERELFAGGLEESLIVDSFLEDDIPGLRSAWRTWERDDESSERGCMGGRRCAERRCTDTPCLLVFFFCWVGMFLILMYAAAHGNVDKVTHGFDWSGDICGVDKDVKNQPYLYWCKVGEDELSDPVCVQSCPSGPGTSTRCPGRAWVRSSMTPLADGAENKTVIVTRTLDMVPDIHTQAVFKYCLPVGDGKLMDSISKFPVVSSLSSQLWMALQSVMDAKLFLLGVVGFAVVFNFVFLVLVQGCIRLLIHATFCTFVLLFLAAGAWGFAAGVPEDFDSAGFPHTSLTDAVSRVMKDHPHINPLTEVLAPEVARRTAFAIGCLGLLLGSVVACFWCRACTAISRTTEAVKDACSILRESPTIFLQPLLQIIIQVSCLAFLVFRMLLVISLGKVETTSAFDVDSATSIVGIPIQVGGMNRSFVFTKSELYMIVYCLLGSVWIYETVAATGHFAIAHAVTMRKLPHRDTCLRPLPVLRGYFYGVVFHLGTLAAGAFIMGVLRIFTAVAVVLSREVDGGRRAAGGRKRNPVALGISCCCCCCLDCMTWVTQIVNDMAYVDVIAYGHGYFDAAWHVYKKTVTNPLTAGTAVGTMRAIRSVGIASTTALGVCGTYWCLTSPGSAEVLAELGVYTGGSLVMEKDVGLGFFKGSIFGITAMSGLICWLVSLAFMNVLVATAQSLVYLQIIRPSTPGLRSDISFS